MGGAAGGLSEESWRPPGTAASSSASAEASRDVEADTSNTDTVAALPTGRRAHALERRKRRWAARDGKPVRPAPVHRSLPVGEALPPLPHPLPAMPRSCSIERSS